MREIVVQPRDVAGGRRLAAHRQRNLARRQRGVLRGDERAATDIALWIPTTAIFVLLAPFALVLTPLLYFAPRDMRPDPFRTVMTLGTLLLALTGTVLDIDTPDARVRLRFF